MNVATKDAARVAVQNKLDAMTHGEFIQASQYARVNLLQTWLTTHLENTAGVHTVLSYAPIHKWREVDLAPLRVELAHLPFDLAPIVAGAPFPTALYKLIFVPLYGFTTKGYRLGHGGGWYDRLLAQQPQALKIGIGLTAGLVDFPVDTHDVAMDVIVTDTAVYENLTPR